VKPRQHDLLRLQRKRVHTVEHERATVGDLEPAGPREHTVGVTRVTAELFDAANRIQLEGRELDPRRAAPRPARVQPPRE
jgi:hypothetical protein